MYPVSHGLQMIVKLIMVKLMMIYVDDDNHDDEWDTSGDVSPHRCCRREAASTPCSLQFSSSAGFSGKSRLDLHFLIFFGPLHNCLVAEQSL